MSKFLERIYCNQIDDFMTSKCSPFLCGFRKIHNSQYCVLKMIKIWKKHFDKREQIDVILMNFSKIFETINHSLLKLETYGFFYSFS